MTDYEFCDELRQFIFVSSYSEEDIQKLCNAENLTQEEVDDMEYMYSKFVIWKEMDLLNEYDVSFNRR